MQCFPGAGLKPAPELFSDDVATGIDSSRSGAYPAFKMSGDTIKRALLAGAVCLVAAIPLAAHHSLAAKYKTGQVIMLDGTVTKIDWSNPHARLYMDTKGPKGMVEMWNLEMASPNILMLNGWSIDTLRQGDHVVVSAHPSRDGSHEGYATKVLRAGR